MEKKKHVPNHQPVIVDESIFPMIFPSRGAKWYGTSCALKLASELTAVLEISLVMSSSQQSPATHPATLRLARTSKLKFNSINEEFVS